jgi:hypothetical protein
MKKGSRYKPALWADTGECRSFMPDTLWPRKYVIALLIPYIYTRVKYCPTPRTYQEKNSYEKWKSELQRDLISFPFIPLRHTHSASLFFGSWIQMSEKQPGVKVMNKYMSCLQICSTSYYQTIQMLARTKHIKHIKYLPNS